MKQGSMTLVLGLATALCVLALLPLVSPHQMAGAAEKAKAATSEAKAKNGQRQFTGIVTAMDKATITVEKKGKKPQTRTFSRHAETRTEGDLAKDARVTVYYRDQDGQSVAQRVIVKAGNGKPKGSR
jgi:hypothetical protein